MMAPAAVLANDELKRQFILGLRDLKVKEFTWDSRPANYNAALDVATNKVASESVIHDSMRALGLAEPEIKREPLLALDQSADEEDGQVLAAIGRAMQQQGGKEDQLLSLLGRALKQTKWNQKKQGPKRVGGGNMASIRCHFCQKFGHMKRDCRSFAAAQASKRAKETGKPRGGAKTETKGVSKGGKVNAMDNLSQEELVQYYSGGTSSSSEAAEDQENE